MSDKPERPVPFDGLEASMREMFPHLPLGLQRRFENVFDHFARAERLFDVDREMASFRSITGEEEAATALMRAVQIRQYPGSHRLNPARHHHKAAVVAAVTAVRNVVYPALAEFKLVFDFTNGRIDIKIPLSNFGVQRGDELCIQPVEPLGMLHARQGAHELEVFDSAMVALANLTGTGKPITKLINERANDRNRLLYASDDKLPKSRATRESIANKRTHAVTMLALAIMVHQSREHQPMVRQALAAVLNVI